MVSKEEVSLFNLNVIRQLTTASQSFKQVPNGSENNISMLRWVIALTPVIGAILLPVVIPLIMAKTGIGLGIGMALLLSTIWFVAMLRTAEMPH